MIKILYISTPAMVVYIFPNTDNTPTPTPNKRPPIFVLGVALGLVKKKKAINKLGPPIKYKNGSETQGA